METIDFTIFVDCHCPKCGSSKGIFHGTDNNPAISLGDMFLVITDPKSYTCECSSCNWKGDVKELLSYEESVNKIRSTKLNEILYERI